MGRLLLAALWLAAACGRFGFDPLQGGGSSSSPDATGVPDDTGISAVACPPAAIASGTMVSTIGELKNALAAATHNTVVSPQGAETYENIEYRFTGTYAHLVNNLLAADPLARDGGTIDPASTNVR